MNDLCYVRASKIYLQPDPHQKPPPVTEPYQPFDHVPLDKREHQTDDEWHEDNDDEDYDESDGW